MTELNDTADGVFAAKIDGISKGLRMGIAKTYADLLSFDEANLEDDKTSFAEAFLKTMAEDLGQSMDDFMGEQTEALREYAEYCEMLEKLYKVSDDLGYKE